MKLIDIGIFTVIRYMSKTFLRDLLKLAHILFLFEILHVPQNVAVYLRDSGDSLMFVWEFRRRLSERTPKASRSIFAPCEVQISLLASLAIEDHGLFDR